MTFSGEKLQGCFAYLYTAIGSKRGEAGAKHPAGVLLFEVTPREPSVRFSAFGKHSVVAGTLLVAASSLACTSERGESAASDTTAASALASSPVSNTQSTATSASAAPAANSHRVVLNVKGMYCASCEQTVVTMLRRTTGVIRAEVSVERGEATVSYDSRTSPAQLVQVVKSLGYDAAVKQS